METIKERILREGRSLEGGILKVDGFMNHQVDTNFIMEAAKEFAQRFRDCEIDKVITIEASGIPPALMVAHLLGVPMIYAKKKQPDTMSNALTVEVFSYTKNEPSVVSLSRDYLHKGDKVLFIDDFLANGNAAGGIMYLIEQAGAELVGMGFIIEKAFQPGGDFLRGKGIRVESLAKIDTLDEYETKPI